MQQLQILNQNKLLKQNINKVIFDFINTFNSTKTQKRYKTILEEFFKYAKIINLEDLANIHISSVRNLFEDFKDLKTNYDSQKKIILNPSSLNNIAYIIRSFFNYLVDYYNYPKNPLSSYKPLKTKDYSSTDSLNRWELLEILKYAKMQYLAILIKSSSIKKQLSKLRNYLIFWLLALSLRREEIVNLKWDDLKENSYFLVYQKWWSYKYIPLPNWYLDFLLKYKEEKIANNFLSSYIFSPFYNPYSNNIDKPISADYIVQITQKICDKLQINKKITPHSFRKTFIELSLNKNENYNNIMNATGHKSPQMIKYYDYRDKIKNNSINLFSDLF